MGIWQRLTGRKTETRSSPSDSFAAAFGIMPTASGQYVSPVLAENLGTVAACVGAIASGLASLPSYVYRRDGNARTEAPTHPVSRLIARPNEHQTWPDWVEWTVAQVLLHGNSLSAIEYDGAGRPIALTPIPWPRVSVQMLRSGRLVYDTVSYNGPWGGTGQMKRFFSDEVYHLRDRSDDGIIGRSRISRSPDVLGNAAALQDFAGHSWRNQATPSGAVSIEASLNDATFGRLRAQFDQSFTGVQNARRVLILDNKAQWTPLSVSPEDAEVLASRRFSVEELCRLFAVPPPLIQSYEHNTFTNSQQASLWFAQFSLAPWARKLEAEAKRSLFGPSSPYEMELDLSALMRGDFQTRWAAYEIAVRNNVLSADEVREAEGWGPRSTDAPSAHVSENPAQ